MTSGFLFEQKEISATDFPYRQKSLTGFKNRSLPFSVGLMCTEAHRAFFLLQASQHTRE